MANIIKKLKRKHKRKKMQSQRAKLEQEQRAIQQMSPEEAYQNRLRRHKHDALRRTVMSIVAVAAIATVVLLYVERRSYHNYRILSASEQEDVVSTKYLEMSGKILRYSPDGASLVNSSMDTYWSVLYEMQNPVADVKDDRAVIADQMVRCLRCLTKTERLEALQRLIILLKRKFLQVEWLLLFWMAAIRRGLIFMHQMEV